MDVRPLLVFPSYRATELAEELGSEIDVATMAAFHGATLERHAGNLEAAEAELRRGDEVLARVGEKGWRSTVAVRLACVLVAQGKIEEAEDYLRISEQTAASDDLASQVPLRLVRARILAKRASALVVFERGDPCAVPVVLCGGNFRGVHQWSTRLSSPVTVSHPQSRRLGAGSDLE